MSFGFGFGIPSQASASGGATLSLNFAGATSLDPKITFTRASTGSYYGSNGLLALSPVNLLTYSEQFDNAAWIKGSSSVAANSVTAPDGSLTADTLTADGTNAGHYIREAVTLAANTTYTLTVYAKSAGNDWGYINVGGTGAGGYSTFNYSTGSVGSLQSGLVARSITSAGNGWYRATITATTGATVGANYVEFSTSPTDQIGAIITTGGCSFWGAQLQTGSTATTYIPTTATASGAPRFDYDPAAIVQQNLLTYSEQFDNAAWTKSGSTVTANAVVAPDGTTTADKVEETATTGQHLVQQSATVIAASSYSISVYAKAAERSIIRVTDIPSTAAINVDLSAGSILSSSFVTNPQILSVGNGWYRISGSFTSSGTTAAITAYPIVGGTSSYLGVAGNGFYIWGAQLNTGSTALPYLATTSSALTVTGVQPKGLLIEEQRTNLLTYSDDFTNAAWNNSASATTVTANTATAPDGTVTADTWTINAAGSRYISQTKTVAATTAHTVSFYVKPLVSNWFYINIVDGVNNAGYTFNVASGTLGQSISTGLTPTPTITPAGNGWYRCAVTTTTSGTSVEARGQVAASASSVAAAVGDSLYVWGAQLEAGAFATSYVPSTNTFTSRASTATYYGSNGLIQTAATNVARYNYNPANLTVAPTLLLENAATNLITYSEQFDNANWAPGTLGSSVIPNIAVAPDGTVTADQINFSTTANNRLDATSSTTAVAGTSYTFSVWLKGSGTISIAATEASGSPTGEVIVTLTSTWTRYTSTYTAIASGATLRVMIIWRSYNTATSCLAWGAQLEAGSGATSYIPTTSAQVTRAADLSSSAQTTRAADNAVMTGTNFSSWFNAVEGTLSASISKPSLAGNDSVFAAFNDGTANNTYEMYKNASGGINFQLYMAASGVTQATNIVSNVFAANATVNAAGTYKINDVITAASGTLSTVDTSATVPIVTQFSIGSRATSLPWNGHIRSITYWPRRLSNTELQSVTA